MKISTKGRYAVRILLSIARHQERGPVPKKIIAEGERISTDYIEQIMIPLKRAGLVVGFRGTKGGFKLAKEPEKITVFHVLSAAEGMSQLVDCEHMNCHGRDKNKCITRLVWSGASQLLEDYFSKINLRDMLDKMIRCECSETPTYSI